MKSRVLSLSLIAVFSLVTLFGCASNMSRRSSSSVPMSNVISTVQDSRQVEEKKPLAFPADIVVMFIPGKSNYVPNTTLRQAAEDLKKQLLAHPKYVKSVAVVSGDYMESKVSLAQIKSLYSADVAIVLSYEQDQFSSKSGLASLADFTIVGMFIVPGVETKTSTVVDGKVIHIPSRSMIFRASGMDKRTQYSTTVGKDGAAAKESIKSILKATTEFGNALGTKLSKFDNYDLSEAISVSLLTTDKSGDTGAGAKSSNDYWKKVDTYKSSGGGAFGFIPLLLSIAVFCAVRRWK